MVPPSAPLMRRSVDRWILAFYAGCIIVVLLQQWVSHVDYNFAIFRQSFVHLAQGRDLYAAYPAEQVDLFKYSPTFAALFAPFALLPTLVALALWNGLNVLSLWYAVRRLLPRREASLALALMFVEVVRTTQRAQSNALVAALMVLAFVWMQERRQAAAAMAIVLGTSIKLFPALAIIPAILHPRRVRMAGLVVLAGTTAVLLPLLLTSWSSLVAQYVSWHALERVDAGASVGGGAAGLYGGVMYWLRLVFHADWVNWKIQVGGLLVLAAPIARRDRWPQPAFRMRLLSSVLIFSTIFNHQVESPSFVIAMTGVAIWFVISPRRAVDVLLLSLVLLIVSLGSSDVVPDTFRQWVVHYKLKTLPCLVVWLLLQAELLGLRQCDA